VNIRLVASICCTLLGGGCERGEAPAQTWEIAVQGLYAAAISTDATQIISGSMHHGTSVWRMPEFERIYDWRHADGQDLTLVAAAFSPDGSRAVTCDARTLVVWDTTDGTPLQFWGMPGAARDVAIAPNGHEVLLGLTDHSALLFDAADGGHRRTFLHDAPVNSVAVSGDGRFALTGADDHAARLWSIESGELLHRLEHSSPVVVVAMSPDGRLLFSAATNAEVRLWDATSGAATLTLSDRDNGITQARFSPDGEFLLIGTVGGRIEQLSTTSGERLRRWQIEGSAADRRGGSAILALAVAANGRMSAVSGDGQLISLN